MEHRHPKKENLQYQNLSHHVYHIGREPEGRMLPIPRKFCRHILSERTTQAASNKNRLHPVSGRQNLVTACYICYYKFF